MFLFHYFNSKLMKFDVPPSTSLLLGRVKHQTANNLEFFAVGIEKDIEVPQAVQL